jgi:hypothetical protein
MRRTIALAIAALLFVLAGPARADQELIAGLKKLGKAVDEMSANISSAQTDADAEMLAKITRQALNQGLNGAEPAIDVKSSRGFCRVTIEAPQWTLWSEARDGKVVNHGATIH